MSLAVGWEMVIGLEVHAQLKTRSKIFCACPTGFGGKANSRTCPVCLGMPGALPVLNRRVVEMTALLGLALGSRVALRSQLARKNYFYPDLPKGYQISQYDQPLCEGGSVEIPFEGGRRKIALTRIHIEEDAGKNIHLDGRSLVDLNRCGTALAEIVSEPDMRSPEEAREYLGRLRQLLLWLGISDGNMEEGSLRCDANVSVRRVGETELGQRTELKNLNSFKAVAAALAFEAERQIAVLKSGGTVEKSTLLWDAHEKRSRPLRGKEESKDYRYFPEPDLLPTGLSERELSALAAKLPTAPLDRLDSLMTNHALDFYEADILTRERAMVDYYEDLASACDDSKAASRWMLGELSRQLKERSLGIEDLKLRPSSLAELIVLETEGKLSGLAAKSVLEKMLEEGGSATEWMERLDLAQLSDSGELADLVKSVIESNPKEVERYRAGRKKLFGFFVGEIMSATKGKADPKEVSRLLRESLDG
jgi:aspartyl-tRNA(Asn)/glutamyl-tRNA(Gln) amidotransferase subunit B